MTASRNDVTQEVAVAPAVLAAPARPQGRRRSRRRNTNPFLVLAFLLPALALVGVFRVWPAYESIRLSFTDWDGISTPHNIGFANYKQLWNDEHFWHSLLNNGKLLLAVPLFVLVPLLIAAVLQARVPGWSLFRAAFFFPTLLSPAVIGLTFKLLLKEDGPLNYILRAVGLGSFARVWLVDPSWAMIWIIIIGTWSLIGIGVVIFLAAMGAVDPNLIDAARIDGAGWFRVQRHVVFWQILPIIELWTILSLIGVFTGFFALILLMTNGGPDYSTTTADLYAYVQAFPQTSSFQLPMPGYSSAATVVIFGVTILVVGIAFALFRRGRSD